MTKAGSLWRAPRGGAPTYRLPTADLPPTADRRLPTAVPLRFLLEHLAKPLGDDLLLARLHHPHADQQFLPRAHADGRRALAQLARDLAAADAGRRLIDLDLHVRHVVGHLG